MSIPNVPIVNAGSLYVNGLQLSSSGGAKVLSISSGQARDSKNVNDIFVYAPISVNGAVVGPGGVDIAAVVASSMYAVYVIASSTSTFTSNIDLGGGPLSPPAPSNPYPSAGLLSLNSSVPTLPYGYDMYRRVGWVSTDSSANVLAFYQYVSNDQSRQYWYKVPRALGSATSGSTTYVKAPLVSASTPTTSPLPFLVPASASQVYLNVSLTANAAGDSVQFLPYDPSPGSGAGVVQVSGPVVSPAIALASVSVPYGVDAVDYPSVGPIPVPVVLYKTTSSSDVLSLTVCGFLDLL